MSHFIEGIGDEIVWIFLALIAIAVVYVAWKSTGISPTEYYVWLVRLRINQNVNTFQILHMADTDARIFEQRLTRRIRTNTRRAVGSTASASVSQEHRSGENTSEASRRRSLPGLSYTENVHHWEVELVSSTETPEGNTGLRNSDEALIDALQRRTQEESSNNEASNVQTRRFILSRLPVRIDDASSGQETDNDLSVDTDDSSSSINSDEQDQSEESSEVQIDAEVLPNEHDLHSLSPPQDSENTPSESSDVASTSANSDSFPTEPSGKTNIKLKFLDDSQIVATTPLDATVGEFKRRYFYDPILAGKVVRLIYRGQLLRDDSRSLSSYGIHNECVLHCNVSSVPYAQPVSNADRSASRPRPATQTYHGRSIEDNSADPYLMRIRNALIRWMRASYNMVMGPAPSQEGETRDEVAAAAAAASRGVNDRVEAVSLGMLFGQHLHIFFAVKFLLLWTFVYLYPQYTDTFSIVILSFLTVFFATIMLTGRRQAPHPAGAHVT